MRSKAVVGMVAVAMAALGVGLLTPAAGQQLNTFTVVKVVEGPVPAGSVFEVTVSCDSLDVSAPAEGVKSVTVEFDETGEPLGQNTFGIGLFADCTAEETVTNGATVTYACDVVIPSVDAAGAEGQPAAQCLDDQTVRFGEVVGAAGTITVTNTFAEEPPPPPPPPPPPDVDDDVVAATPPFTG